MCQFRVRKPTWSALVRRALRHENAGVDALVLQTPTMAGRLCALVHRRAGQQAYPRSIVFPPRGRFDRRRQGPFGGVTDFDGRNALAYGVGRQLFTPSYVSAAYTADYDAELALSEIRRLGCRSVGLVSPASMYYGFGTKLRTDLAAAGVRLADLTGQIDQLKPIKSAEEQDLIRRTRRDCRMRCLPKSGSGSARLKGFRDRRLRAVHGPAARQREGHLIGSSAHAGSLRCSARVEAGPRTAQPGSLTL